MKKNDLSASPLKSIFLSAISADESQTGIGMDIPVLREIKMNRPFPAKVSGSSEIPPVIPKAIFRAF